MVNARQVHREQFWNHLNREEILLHDHASWQKLAQLEENSKPKQIITQKHQAEASSTRKRDTKAYSKLVKNAMKTTNPQKLINSKTCNKELMLKSAFDKAMEGFTLSIK